MQRPRLSTFAVLCGALAAGPAAFAHVTLAQRSATAGTAYEAALRVGHACQGAGATNGITVRLPEGFVLADAQPRAGWTLSIERQAAPVTVRWLAQDAANALPTGERAQFVLHGTLPAQAGPLYFKVRQDCDVGSADWAQLPMPDGAKPAFPAARLEVLAPGAQADPQDAGPAPAGGHVHAH